MNKLTRFIKNVSRRTQIEQEVSEELRFHLEKRITDLINERGLSQEEARRQARIEFGSAEKYKEEVRQAHGLQLFDELRSNLKYSIRALVRNKAFAVAAIATLALGIGANTAIFSLAEFLLLRPLTV